MMKSLQLAQSAIDSQFPGISRRDSSLDPSRAGIFLNVAVEPPLISR